MNDPKRMLSAQGEADPLERELLEGVPHIGPPQGARDRAWDALAGQLAAATVVGAGLGTASAAGAAAKATVGTGALGAKVLAVLVAGGLAASTGVWATSSTHNAARRAPAAVATKKRASSQAVPLQDPAEQEIPAEVAPTESPTESHKASALKRRDALLRESALLRQARAQLQSGDASAAQASLDRLESELPYGVLRQERAVLAIGVLSAEGHLKRAQQRAREFVRAHPQSPHSATLRELLEQP